MCQTNEKQEDGEKILDEGRRARYVTWVLRIITGLIILVAIIAHFWLVPAKFQREIKRSLLRFWDGQVEIDDLEVNYFAPIYLGGVRFIDRAGRECLHAGRVKMIFAKWPGMHPVVTEVEIEGLNLKIQLADKKLTLPFTYPSERTPRSRKTADIRTLTIKDAEITIVDTRGSETLYENLQLLVTKDDNFYDVLFNRIDSASLESFLAHGRIDSKTLEAELSLQMKHVVKKSEMALIFAALDIPEISADGKLEADLTMIGCLKQLAGLITQGTVNINDWTVAKNDKIIVDNLATKVNARDGWFAFENITANVFNGSTIGSLYVESRQDGPAIFGGSFLARKMDFVELTSVLGGPGRKATRGMAAFSYNFTGEGADLQNLVGRGQIYLDDADITVIPVIPYIFNIMGLSRFNPLEMSDAGCVFTTNGSVVTIEAADVANFLAAIRAEPGGTINLQTKQIDMYVMALPIKQIDDIIGPVPIVNIFVNFKNKLTRLHVRGPWSDKPAGLITKEPINDVKEATIGFFLDVIKTGDQLTQLIRNRLGIFPVTENEQPSAN